MGELEVTVVVLFPFTSFTPFMPSIGFTGPFTGPPGFPGRVPGGTIRPGVVWLGVTAGTARAAAAEPPEAAGDAAIPVVVNESPVIKEMVRIFVFITLRKLMVY